MQRGCGLKARLWPRLLRDSEPGTERCISGRCGPHNSLLLLWSRLFHFLTGCTSVAALVNASCTELCLGPEGERNFYRLPREL